MATRELRTQRIVVRRRLLIGFALPALLATGATAQSAPQPSGSRLTLGSDTMATYLIRGTNTTLIGSVVDQLSERNLNGRRVLHRDYRAENQASGPSLDTLIDDEVRDGRVTHTPTIAPAEKMRAK